MNRARVEPGTCYSRLRTFASAALLLLPPLAAALGLLAWVEYRRIDDILTEKFAGRRWDFPSKVYSDSYTIYPGLWAGGPGFARQLADRGYLQVTEPPRRGGEFRIVPGAFAELYLRPFEYPGRREPGRLLRLELDRSGYVTRIEAPAEGASLTSVLLEPALLAGLHGSLREDRREMTIEEVPAPLVTAVLAVEDKRFFEHAGIDVRGLLRAFVVNVLSGKVKQGGSTLTQQLMKNFFLTEERTLSRKIKEAAMAVVAEHRFSKLEILETYLNEIYMGQRGSVSVHGMWEASKLYFGREPRELSLGQIATLAGMIRAPNYYSPHEHPERARERRDLVLRLLQEQGDIDAKTYVAAVDEPLDVVPPTANRNLAPYFVDFVRQELRENYPGDVLTTEGFKIFTSLDVDLQTIAEEAVKHGMQRIEDKNPRLRVLSGEARLEAALIALKPSTGAILAMVGGRDYGESQFNRVTQSKRQPGSVFKPIVMLAAIGSERLGDAHYLPNTPVLDRQFVWEYDGKTWSPSNYNDDYRDRVTLRVALEQSLNAATARIARDVGLDAIRRLAVRLGLDDDIPAYPAIVLGGHETSVFDIARAYSVFANSGFSAAPLSVVRVTDRAGNLIEGHRVAITRVIPAADAYLVTHLLEGVMQRGTGRLARAFGFHASAAGKTGTTNDYNDAWFVGYTPDLLAVVWVGFDRDAQLGMTGGQAALPIWAEFMRKALEGRPSAEFVPPPGVVVEDIDVATGLKARPECGEFVSAAFLAGEEPETYCVSRDNWMFLLH